MSSALVYACAAAAQRLNAKISQMHAIAHTLQQREQANQQATHHKEQTEALCVQFCQQLGQKLRNCQQELSSLESQPNVWQTPLTLVPPAFATFSPQPYQQQYPQQMAMSPMPPTWMQQLAMAQTPQQPFVQ